MPDPSAGQIGAGVTFSDGTFSYPVVSDRFDNVATAQLGPDREYDGSLTQITGTWARPARPASTGSHGFTTAAWSPGSTAR
ncbi:hypothetical protein GCM10010149_85450 [Nonomuraea roseoviolacea subsp. roseoviolacea]